MIVIEIGLQLVCVALLVWTVTILHRSPTALPQAKLALTAMANVPQSAQRVLMLCGPDGMVQHEVSTSAREIPVFPRDYAYGGTIYRLVVADETVAQYRAVVGTQAKRAVTRAQ
jgi:hypothetical protein